MMLSRTSERWHELAQAYGPADDIPRLLDALDAAVSEGDIADLWYGLWATLFPDGKLYDAVYAAVPHLVMWARAKRLREKVLALHFVTGVECARALPSAPHLPDDLVRWYADAVEGLPALVLECASEPWSAEVAAIMAAALMAGKRQSGVAGAILALTIE